MTYTENCPSCSTPVVMHHKADHAWGECPCGEYFEVSHYDE